MKTLIALLTILIFTGNVFAIDTSVDTQKSIKSDKEKSQSLKKSQEQKDTKGKKKSDTASIGRDKTDSDTIKAIGQAMSSAGADVTLPLEVVFLDRIAEMEKRERHNVRKERKEKMEKLFLVFSRSNGEKGTPKDFIALNTEERQAFLKQAFPNGNKDDFSSFANDMNALGLFLQDLAGSATPDRKAAELLDYFVKKYGINRDELLIGPKSTGIERTWADGETVSCEREEMRNSVIKLTDKGKKFNCGSFYDESIADFNSNYLEKMLLDSHIRDTLFAIANKHFKAISESDFNDLIKFVINWKKEWEEFKKSNFNDLDTFHDWKKGLISNDDLTIGKEEYEKGYIVLKENAVVNFQSCKIVTNPKLPRDFGLSAEIRPGVIDNIKAGYLLKMAQSNSYVETILGIDNEIGIKFYRNCLANYGAIIAQAYLNLTQDLQDLKASVTKSKSGEINVKGMGYDDFILLADAALQKALQGFTNGTIKRVYERVINDTGACQFDRTMENIKCGSSLITLGTIPKLAHGGIHVYGGQYMGYQGSYKLSKSWSYQDAIEKLKVTSKYSKWANEVAKYSEELESQGRTKEATMVRKKAWEIAKTGKQTVNVSQLLQPIH